MESKKVPISFNEKELEEVQKMADILGFGSITNNYGAFPKVVKKSIFLGQEYVKLLEKFIPDFKEDELEAIFTTIKRLKLEKYKKQELEVLKNKQEELRKGITS